MASPRIVNLMAAIVAVAAVAAAAAAAAQGTTEKNVNLHCMRECYFDCTQIKIFSESECKKECVLGCARYFMRKAAQEDEDDTNFFPLWI